MLRVPQSLGFLGGRPNHAIFFIGAQGLWTVRSYLAPWRILHYLRVALFFCAFYDSGSYLNNCGFSCCGLEIVLLSRGRVLLREALLDLASTTVRGYAVAVSGPEPR